MDSVESYTVSIDVYNYVKIKYFLFLRYVFAPQKFLILKFQNKILALFLVSPLTTSLLIPGSFSK